MTKEVTVTFEVSIKSIVKMRMEESKAKEIEAKQDAHIEDLDELGLDLGGSLLDDIINGAHELIVLDFCIVNRKE